MGLSCPTPYTLWRFLSSLCLHSSTSIFSPPRVTMSKMWTKHVPLAYGYMVWNGQSIEMHTTWNLLLQHKSCKPNGKKINNSRTTYILHKLVSFFGLWKMNTHLGVWENACARRRKKKLARKTPHIHIIVEAHWSTCTPPTCIQCVAVWQCWAHYLEHAQSMSGSHAQHSKDTWKHHKSLTLMQITTNMKWCVTCLGLEATCGVDVCNH